MLHVVTPPAGRARAWSAGTPFASRTPSPRPARSGRPTLPRGIDNAVLAGSSPCPASGCPTALLSGRLAADRITGAVDPATATVSPGGADDDRSELDAAGITRPALRDAYRHCRALNAAARPDVLPGHPAARPEQRPAVHALYGFARRADDIVDDFDAGASTAERADRLQQLARAAVRPAGCGTAGGDDPALAAVVHTAAPVRHRLGSCSTTSSPRCGWT